MKKFLRSAVIPLACALFIPCFAACGDGDKKIEGSWEISAATLDGKNVRKNFQAFTANFKTDGKVSVSISYLGAYETRNSEYTFDGVTLKENYRGETYVWNYAESTQTFTTEYRDYDDVITVVLEKKQEETGPVPVDFEDILFGTDMSDSKFYNYCPAIIRETENGQEVMHVWYCTNRDDGVMMDYIGYRKGVLQADGKWLFGDQIIALAPTEGTWDGRHTCDPAVITGKFRYKNAEYKYLMAYLGCVTEDYQKNETGIAVSNSPEGPWVKINTDTALIPWYDDGDLATEQKRYESLQGTSGIYWGTGMPALVSIDGEGEVLMFYQSTLRGTGIRRYDFSDLDGELTPKFVTSIRSNGILRSDGKGCGIGIPDFAYDETAKRFYVCGVTNEKNPADISTTRVNSHSMVAYLENVESMETLCTTLQSGSYTWNMLGHVGPGDTGFERNHNPGIVRTGRGGIPDSSKVEIIVSTGHNSWENENIFTYRLYGQVLPVTKN